MREYYIAIAKIIGGSLQTSTKLVGTVNALSQYFKSQDEEFSEELFKNTALNNDAIQEKKEVVKTVINKNYNFNISINDMEIFSKRNFWNKYPNYENIVNKIQEKLNEKNIYAAMKAAYDFNNELF